MDEDKVTALMRVIDQYAKEHEEGAGTYADKLREHIVDELTAFQVSVTQQFARRAIDRIGKMAGL